MSLTHRPLIRPLALVLVTGAVAAPAASARMNLSEPPLQPASDQQLLTPTPQTVTAQSSGFDWGDAGIGAGAVVALTLTGLGARLTVGRHRQLHSTTARPTISAT
ncbi:MAG: hypothetical protein JWL67_1812 [Solirubrobacterales bacterium]|nr:hypothetical protein [Solirubrobacterales bacterium]